MSESKSVKSLNGKTLISKYLPSVYETKIPWWPFIIAGIVVSAVLGATTSLGDVLPSSYVVAGIAGIFVSLIILQKPEFGAYILIISIFTSLSDILTDRGLPSINRPLIALTIGSVLVNYFLKTGRYNKFPTLTRLEWALIIFYMAIIVSVLVSPDKSNAFSVTIDITKDILVGVSIYITLNTEERWKTGVLVLLVTITILATMGVFKTATGSDITFFDMARNSAFGQVSYGELRYGGPIQEPNLWGQVLVSSLPFSLYLLKQEQKSTRRILIIFSLLMILLAMIYTSSRGAIVAFTIIVPLMAIDMKIKPISLMIGVLLFISLLSILPASYSDRFQSLNIFSQPTDGTALNQDESVIGREAVMLTGLAMFKKNPVFGVGFGNYGLRYWEYATDLGLEANATDVDFGPNSRFAHSLYIEILSETGLFGFIAFLLFFSTLFIEMFRIRKIFNIYAIQTNWSSWATALAMSVLTFLISGIFLHGIFFRYIWILIGLAMAAISIADDTDDLNQTIPMIQKLGRGDEKK